MERLLLPANGASSFFPPFSLILFLSLPLSVSRSPCLSLPLSDPCPIPLVLPSRSAFCPLSCTSCPPFPFRFLSLVLYVLSSFPFRFLSLVLYLLSSLPVRPLPLFLFPPLLSGLSLPSTASSPPSFCLHYFHMPPTSRLCL